MKETGFKYRDWISKNKFETGLTTEQDLIVKTDTLNEIEETNKK